MVKRSKLKCCQFPIKVGWWMLYLSFSSVSNLLHFLKWNRRLLNPVLVKDDQSLSVWVFLLWYLFLLVTKNYCSICWILKTSVTRWTNYCLLWYPHMYTWILAVNIHFFTNWIYSWCMGPHFQWKYSARIREKENKNDFLNK